MRCSRLSRLEFRTEDSRRLVERSIFGNLFIAHSRIYVVALQIPLLLVLCFITASLILVGPCGFYQVSRWCRCSAPLPRIYLRDQSSICFYKDLLQFFNEIPHGTIDFDCIHVLILVRRVRSHAEIVVNAWSALTVHM